MFYAENAISKHVHISEASKDEQYTCPCCGSVLIQKRGRIKAHHFAHEKDSICDSWADGMTPWHMNWQSNFSRCQCEQKLTIGKDTHIADVMIRNVVVEFQHSGISSEEFKKRCIFYSMDRRKLIWVLDALGWSILRADNGKREYGKYHWSRPKHFLSDINPDNEYEIEIFLHISENTLIHVNRLIAYSNRPYEWFYATSFSIHDFTEYLKNIVDYSWMESTTYPQTEEYRYFKTLMDEPSYIRIR